MNLVLQTNLVAIIVNLEKWNDLRNSDLLRLLNDKLPYTLVKQWEKKLIKKKCVAILTSFSHWLGEQVELACQTYIPPPEEKKDRRDEKKVWKSSRPPHNSEMKSRFSSPEPTAANLLSVQRQVKKCLFCDSPKHFARDCEKAKKMPHAKKAKIIGDIRICEICFVARHTWNYYEFNDFYAINDLALLVNESLFPETSLNLLRQYSSEDFPKWKHCL